MKMYKELIIKILGIGLKIVEFLKHLGTLEIINVVKFHRIIEIIMAINIIITTPVINRTSVDLIFS